MEFYQAIQNRKTVREFSDKTVPRDVLEKILSAGLQAPSHNHLREWDFVVLQEQKDKENALSLVDGWAKKAKEQIKGVTVDTSLAKNMYAYAMPRQYDMLVSCPCVVLPFFKSGAGLLHPSSLSALNPFASIWCVIENIFLATAAEGLACCMRIPVGEEGEYAAKAVGAPDGYQMPCFIGIGYAADAATELEQHAYTAEQKTHYGTW